MALGTLERDGRLVISPAAWDGSGAVGRLVVALATAGLVAGADLPATGNRGVDLRMRDDDAEALGADWATLSAVRARRGDGGVTAVSTLASGVAGDSRVACASALADSAGVDLATSSARELLSVASTLRGCV